MEHSYSFASIENIPGCSASAVFTESAAAVFREEGTAVPLPLPGNLGEIVPWGANNRMPFEVLDRIEADETMSACMEFQSEAFYGAGLQFDTSNSRSDKTDSQVREFRQDCDLSSFWLGTAQDLKHFAFAVSLITLNADGSRIVSLSRLEACYCRFAPVDARGRIPTVFYANWRYPSLSDDDIEAVPLLDPKRPFDDLRDRLRRHASDHRFAMVIRIPKADSTYYPIPAYASLFRSKWYDIKRLIAVAKEAKLRNSAPIKYHIQVSEKYFPRLFKAEGITDPAKQQIRVIEEKKRMVEFLTGAHNSGKAWFSIAYVTPDGRTQSDVTITRIESAKEGGDWETDIQEAINMVCFAMRVHSNLVGSVPGKSQSNNSGSDKRELYTIAQALQKPYRDLAFTVPALVCRFNGWEGVRPVCPFIQLTTLDEHADARSVDIP